MDALTIFFIALAIIAWCLLGFGLLISLMSGPQPNINEWLLVFACGPISWVLMLLFLIKETYYEITKK